MVQEDSREYLNSRRMSFDFSEMLPEEEDEESDKSVEESFLLGSARFEELSAGFRWAARREIVRIA